MHIIFRADPMDSRKPDSMYEAEVAAARELGFTYDLLNFEALVYEQNPQKAVQRIREQVPPNVAIYRGWMLKPYQYEQLYQALATRGITLINDPAAYKHCHYLPESYAIIAGYTPKSVWLQSQPNSMIEAVQLEELLQPFDGKSVIVKDYVKSQKHYWREACFIPDSSQLDNVEKVVKRFIELQDSDLNEGLVFREFVEFEPLADHSKSGMPLTKEFRIFWLDGEPICSAPYWPEGDYEKIIPPLDSFKGIARQVKSRFFTMDIAKRINGDWMIMELGDAQVAGLPERLSAHEFYKALQVSL